MVSISSGVFFILAATSGMAFSLNSVKLILRASFAFTLLKSRSASVDVKVLPMILHSFSILEKCELSISFDGPLPKEAKASKMVSGSSIR
ncbi:hypothetical protein Q4I32_000547 [Leishmania shawi]|uniref:Secreted protein n=1 Tax=Leishmania shawi TaxID=5680 RepID=A0AAW3CC60_9TRYP